jgi:pimeloyl-ACP methyl ester carboxylesterase
MDVMLRNRFTVAKHGWQPRWFNPDLEKWLHRIKLPALIVWDDDDKIMPPQYAGAVA